MARDKEKERIRKISVERYDNVISNSNMILVLCPVKAYQQQAYRTSFIMAINSQRPVYLSVHPPSQHSDED